MQQTTTNTSIISSDTSIICKGWLHHDYLTENHTDNANCLDKKTETYFKFIQSNASGSVINQHFGEKVLFFSI